jgi:uncharacterized damage-inducible protein DinB
MSSNNAKLNHMFSVPKLFVDLIKKGLTKGIFFHKEEKIESRSEFTRIALDHLLEEEKDNINKYEQFLGDKNL